MVKGVLVGLGIMIVCALIPIVHFIAVPASPFIAGYFGVGYAKSASESYGAKGLKYGSSLGLVLLVITSAAAATVIVLVEPSQKILVLMWK